MKTPDPCSTGTLNKVSRIVKRKLNESAAMYGLLETIPDWEM